MLTLSSAALAESQFYLFPVGVLEGISDKTPNAVLDPGIVEALKDPKTNPDQAIIARFESAMRRTFPQSTVHRSQVGMSASGGALEFIPNSACGGRFTAPVTSSYAAVLAVTRASEYRNERAGQVDIQIPITLTLQIIKPDRGRVAYTLSDTLYSPFIFSRQEAALPATTALIRSRVLENVLGQVDHLVAEAGKVFNPKASVVKVVGRSGKYLVLDGGYETGFKKDEELLASRVDKPDVQLVFKVIAANSGHSIVRLMQGEVEVGAGLNFVFDQAADDSAKPGLLPVTRFTERGEASDLEAAVAQQFVKNLGFSSRFNIVPVNPNFKTTMGLIQAGAPCVEWSQFPGSSPTKESRTDLPHFFAHFDIEASETYRNEGPRNPQGVSTESEEDFAVATAVRLIDSKMRVHYSEAVVEPYKIRRVNGKGMDSRSGKDVAIKNSVLKLAASFAKNAKLEVRELTVSRVEGNRMWVSAPGLNPADVSAFTVFRDLDVMFKGNKVALPLELGEGSEPRVEADKGELALSFSRVTPETPLPRKGDRVRLEGLAKPGAVNLHRCPLPDYLSDRSAYQPKFARLFVEAGINSSPRLQLVEPSPAFFTEATQMLDAGNFKSGSLSKPVTPSLCFQVGAAIRPDATKCEGGRCKATVVNGLIVRFGNGGAAPGQQVQAAQQTEVSNVLEAQMREFLGYSSMLWFDALQGEFKKRLQAFTPK
ncbi:MAG: hypothetical protein WCK08_02260 [Betaproteobacteria bacterium]